jgi:hypothetical protein
MDWAGGHSDPNLGTTDPSGDASPSPKDRGVKVSVAVGHRRIERPHAGRGGPDGIMAPAAAGVKPVRVRQIDSVDRASRSKTRQISGRGMKPGEMGQWRRNGIPPLPGGLRRDQAYQLGLGATTVGGGDHVGHGGGISSVTGSPATQTSLIRASGITRTGP